MAAFGLLVLTVFFTWLAYDAFRFAGAVRSSPFHTMSHLWKGVSDVPASEQGRVKEYVASRVYERKFGVVFLVAALVCAGLTFRAFISGLEP